MKGGGGGGGGDKNPSFRMDLLWKKAIQENKCNGNLACL